MQSMAESSTMSNAATAGPSVGTLTVCRRRSGAVAAGGPAAVLRRRRSAGRWHRLHAGLACLPPPLAAGDPAGLTPRSRGSRADLDVFAQGYEAVAWLRIRDKSGMLSSGGRDNAEYESYRKTQVQLIKSPFVLTSALRRPGVADLKTIREEDDPVGWLTRYIQVAAPMESEVLQVRLRGENAADLAKIVNAVTSSYLDDIVDEERAERLGRRDALEKKYKENMSELRTRHETFDTLAAALGTRDSSQVVTQRSLLLDHLGTLRVQVSQMQRDIAAIDAELAVLDAKAKGDLSADDSVPEEFVSAALLRDPQVNELTSRLASVDESIAYQQQRQAPRGPTNPPSSG